MYMYTYVYMREGYVSEICIENSVLMHVIASTDVCHTWNSSGVRLLYKGVRYYYMANRRENKYSIIQVQ